MWQKISEPSNRLRGEGQLFFQKFGQVSVKKLLKVFVPALWNNQCLHFQTGGSPFILKQMPEMLVLGDIGPERQDNRYT